MNFDVLLAKEFMEMTAPKPSRAPKSDPVSDAEKEPGDWTTGDERMTGAQASYLKTLSEEAGRADGYDETLTKAEASRRIDELQAETGRGQ